MKKILKIVVAAFMLYAVTAAFFGFDTDLVCRIQPAATIWFLVVLLLVGGLRLVVVQGGCVGVVLRRLLASVVYQGDRAGGRLFRRGEGRGEGQQRRQQGDECLAHEKLILFLLTFLFHNFCNFCKNTKKTLMM